MPATCPACATSIKDTVLEELPDTVVCPRCGHEARPDELVWSRDADLGSPPSGTSFEHSKDGWTLRASTRNATGCILIPFTCVWLAVLMAVGARTGFSDWIGVSISLVFTFFFVGLSLMVVFGEIIIAVTGDTGTIFSGIGGIGWRQRFDWSAVDYAKVERTGRGHRQIALVGTTVKFGLLLSDERKSYIVEFVRGQATNRDLRSCGPGRTM